MRKKKVLCPKCKKHKKLTRHHYLPLRFFGRKNNNKILLICRECHDKLELLIPSREQKSVQFYYDVVKRFLNS